MRICKYFLCGRRNKPLRVSRLRAAKELAPGAGPDGEDPSSPPAPQDDSAGAGLAPAPWNRRVRKRRAADCRPYGGTGETRTPSVTALAGDAPCHLPQRGRQDGAAGDRLPPLRRVLPSPRTGKVAPQGPDEVPAERIRRFRVSADVSCRRGAGGASPSPAARTERRRRSRALREAPLRWDGGFAHVRGRGKPLPCGKDRAAARVTGAS